MVAREQADRRRSSAAGRNGRVNCPDRRDAPGGRRRRSTTGDLKDGESELKQMYSTASNVQVGGYFARIDLAISARASSRCRGSVSQSCQVRAILFTTCSATALPRRSARSLRYS